MTDARAALPPGPRLPGIVKASLLLNRQHQLIRYLHRVHGATFGFPVPGIGEVVYVCDPEDIRTVFRGDARVFHAGEANLVLQDVLGRDSVFIADDDPHRRLRHLMSPAFHTGAVRRQIPTIAEIARAEIGAWPVGEEFALHPCMQRITLEVILRLVIGVDDPTRLAALRELLPRLVRRIRNPAMLLPPVRAVLRRLQRGDDLLQQVDALVYEQIASHRAAADLDDRADVLAMLARARDENGAPMPDSELRDQLITLLLAGLETTATGLAWSFERLMRHPEVLERTRRAALAGDDAYLDAVVQESLRARPVVFEVGRLLKEPVELGGYRLAAGTTVVASIELAHESAANYADPEEYRPERFLDAKHDSARWFPFGGGVRRCVGVNLASVTMRTVLREVLTAVRFEHRSDAGEAIESHHVTLVPGRKVRATVRERLTPLAPVPGCGATA